MTPNRLLFTALSISAGALTLLAPESGFAQTVVFSDDFDDGDPGGVVSSENWPSVMVGGIPVSVPGKIYGYPLHEMQGSDAGHQKNHTASPDVGGSAFEVDANPYGYASYHEFDAADGILRLSAWVWDDAERPLCTPSIYPVRGMVGLTSVPGEMLPDPAPVPNRPNEIYDYADFAFIGVESPVSNDPDDPPQKFYQWRTKTDGWNLTNVPRKVDYVCQGEQTWRHVEIVVHPYSGQAGDIQFFIDGQLVGQGHRVQGDNCRGAEFRRIQMGTRFGEVSDALNYKPPYSYEHFWFDDIELTEQPPTESPCPNPELRFDADADGDVDQEDLGAFQVCYTGGGGTLDCPACKCMNSDNDADIDEDDYSAFEACASGAEVPAIVTCDDALPPP